MCFFGQPQKWQNNFKLAPKLSLVSLLMGNFQSFEFEAVFGYKRPMFLTFSNAKNDIIWGAWGRQFGIRKENDHVV